MHEPITFQMPALDTERDIYPTVLCTPDYNGEPQVYVFVLGELVMRVRPGDDWKHEAVDPTETYGRQAVIALLYRIGEITEDAEQEFTRWVGLPNDEERAYQEALEEVEGHELVGFANDVSKAVFERLGEEDGYLSEPRQ